MKTRYISVLLLLVLLMALLLLSACNPREEIPNTPSSQDNASQQKLQNTEVAQQAGLKQEELNAIVHLYEKCVSGVDFSDLQENNDFGFVAYGWLLFNGYSEEFSKDGIITFPLALGNQLLGLLFEKDAFAPKEEYPYNYGLGGLRDEKVELNVFELSTKMDASGSLEEATVLYGRFLPLDNGQKQWLYPVTYTFKPYTLTQEDIPELTNFPYQAGDTVYHIVNVVNSSTVEQAQEIYTRYGFGELFEEKSYTLSTPEDLLEMVERVNSGVPNEVQAVYTLANNIDMAGVSFTPIGSNITSLEHDKRNPHSSGFCGRFEGNNFTISNLTYHASSFEKNTSTYYGMFSLVGLGGLVRNLRLDNASFTFEERNLPASAIISAGLLAGELCGATVEGCHVNGTVSGTSSVGALVGDSTADFGWDYSAPTPSFISGCTANATVIGRDSVGGLVGTNHYTHTSNSRATGTVLAQNVPASSEMPRNIGGLAGHNIAGSIIDSFCDTEVKTAVPSACVGKFVGLNEGDVNSSFYCEDRGGSWKGIGDSPRPELMASAEGLSAAAYKERNVDMLPKESNSK